ncbi:N-acetylmuramoyl-L-alanine amidase [Salinithrix halophila]|uniref:N-acetylmuramoyl-L-alanine amidase n=1 Tax=Salinithrix halophila TaxID=1485204 RepID=A0ABV8JD22_9BACL
MKESIICLDPGHGGVEYGVKAYGLSEKDVCLDMTRRIAAYLNRHGKVRGLLTRAGDTALDWRERIRQAEDIEADLLLSIHTNGSENPMEAGFETYISGCAGLDLRSLQARLHNHVAAFLRPFGIWDRGKKYDSESYRGWIPLLEEAPCPAIQLELFYLTHAGEKSWYRHSRFRDALAFTIAEGAALLLQRENRLPVR